MHRVLSMLAFCASLAPLPGSAEPADATALGQLSGTFISPQVETWYGGFGTREFIFADGQWQLIFTHALDPGMTQRTFQFRTGGSYRIGAPAGDSAFQADFDENWKHLTPLTTIPEVITGMGLAACGLPFNLETDISATGCGPWKSVADCGTDHDLLSLDATGLRFGARPADNDMCSPERRPTTLTSPVVALTGP